MEVSNNNVLGFLSNRFDCSKLQTGIEKYIYVALLIFISYILCSIYMLYMYEKDCSLTTSTTIYGLTKSQT